MQVLAKSMRPPPNAAPQIALAVNMRRATSSAMRLLTLRGLRRSDLLKMSRCKPLAKPSPNPGSKQLLLHLSYHIPRDRRDTNVLFLISLLAS